MYLRPYGAPRPVALEELEVLTLHRDQYGFKKLLERHVMSKLSVKLG